MKNEYLPCTECQLPYCFLDKKLFEKPIPIDACWELYDMRKERDPWRELVDRYVAQRKAEDEDLI